ncbi:Mitochondrial import inner membrane translocase subunit Tim23 [Halotydeus destructor]|nr:Mitochondrial import inner membrane translocase subunit Tim23 [Halotydeus destructor]
MADADPKAYSSSSSSYSALGGFGGALSSPYLNFDPKVISPGINDSQWIFPDGAINKPSRGRFEMAFSQIGGSVFTGAAVGGAFGVVHGAKATSPEITGQQLSAAVRRTQMLNYIVKNGSNAANACGVVAVLYSAIGVGLSFVHESSDDINSVVAGAATGLIYGSISHPRPKGDLTSFVKPNVQQRLRRSVVGTLIGTALTCSYVLLFNKEKYFG